MRKRIPWLILLAAFLALNALLFSSLDSSKSGAIQASAINLGFR